MENNISGEQHFKFSLHKSS